MRQAHHHHPGYVSPAQGCPPPHLPPRELSPQATAAFALYKALVRRGLYADMRILSPNESLSPNIPPEVAAITPKMRTDPKQAYIAPEIWVAEKITWRPPGGLPIARPLNADPEQIVDEILRLFPVRA